MKPFIALGLPLITIVSIATWLWNMQIPALSNNLDSDESSREVIEQVSNAFSRSELVILGTVVGIKNYLPTDGGYGYEITVSEILKGVQADRYLIRAVGWAYTIPFNRGDKVLLFLNRSDSLLIKEPFVVALDNQRKPLAFRIETGQLVAVAPPDWHSSLEGYSLEQIRKIGLGE